VNDIAAIADGNSPVQGEIRLMRTDRGIMVKGTLDTEIELTCSRCLCPFDCPLRLNIEEEYVPTTDIVTGASLSLPDESGCFTINEQNILDLTEAIHQYAQLAIPIKSLCRENCAGLCPSCGQNLNQAPCNCPPEPADPRWSELTKLASASKQSSLNELKGTK